jgi:hypothetical protein
MSRTRKVSSFALVPSTGRLGRPSGVFTFTVRAVDRSLR